jgi:hypothetical protein
VEWNGVFVECRMRHRGAGTKIAYVICVLDILID